MTKAQREQTENSSGPGAGRKSWHRVRDSPGGRIGGWGARAAGDAHLRSPVTTQANTGSVGAIAQVLKNISLAKNPTLLGCEKRRM